MMNVELLFMDVDGTLTDGKIYMGVGGELFKVFDIKDGFAIHDILPVCGIIPVIISSRESDIVINRCKELGIKHIYQKCNNKKEQMLGIAKSFDITLNENGILSKTAYIGDDLSDLECIKIVEYSGCPADAVKQVKKNVSYISGYPGGNGAVRDFIEWLLDLNSEQ